MFALVGVPVFGQTAAAEAAAERAKKQKELDEQIVTLLDRTIAEIGALKLAQNRAVIGALAGDIYWRYDSKRSREIFRGVAGELLNHQADYEREKQENTMQGVLPGFVQPFDPNDPRLDVLNLIGGRDPELGLELMAQTRPPAIAEAMARIAQQAAMYPTGTGSGTTMIGSGGAGIVNMAAGSGVSGTGTGMPDFDRMRAQQEINLEQSLTLRAAANDPEKLVKVIKDSLAKGISYSIYGSLQQLMMKDEKKALEMGEEVVSKITSTDLTRSQEDLNGAISFLNMMARPAPAMPPGSRVKMFAFTAAQSKDVALKLANTFLQTGVPAFVSGSLSRALPSIEKLAPERAAQLKLRDAQNKKPLGNVTVGARGNATQPRWSPNDTPEAIIAAAAKISDQRDRYNALQAAANKIGQIADEVRAKKIIDSIPDARLRTQAKERFEANRANKLTSEGRLEEAKAAIAAQPNPRMRIQQTVSLAMQFFRKNTEKDREAAAELMMNAKGQTNPYIENEDDLADHMQLINGYALMEPDTAFRMLEPIMDQFNDMINASAVLARYNKNDRTFKKGELSMRINGTGNGMLPFRYIMQIQSLARVDVDRMSLLADRYQRSDARTLMKLYVLQGYQRGGPMVMPPPPLMMVMN
jgi:hypothetical protein